MKHISVATSLLLSLALTTTARAQAQRDTSHTDNLPTDQGRLPLESITVRLLSGNLQVAFVPLDERVLRLLTKESYHSMEHLLGEQQRQIDSVAQVSGVTDLGIAWVSFQGLAPNTSFDPQQVTVTFHGQQFRPAGFVALSPGFTNQVLDLRQQVQGLLLYRRDIPVREGFSLSYLGATANDWDTRMGRFDGERTRILGLPAVRRDTTHQR
jgi:hypothetical protein